MFRSALVVAVAALTAVTSAQNYSTSGDLSIDASQIPIVERQAWCRAQTNNCPLICGGRASPNTCEPDDLTFDCTCSDGASPNITDYDQTLPSFVCRQWIENCVDNHPDDLEGITACRSVTCGERNASESSGGSDSDSTTSASPSASPTGSGADSSETESPSETSDAQSSASPEATENAAVMHIASNYGTGIVFAGMLAVFGLAL